LQCEIWAAVSSAHYVPFFLPHSTHTSSSVTPIAVVVPCCQRIHNYVTSTVVSGYLVPFVHCTLQSLVWLYYWNCRVSHDKCHWVSRELCGSNFNHVSDCSVQWANRTRNTETTEIEFRFGYCKLNSCLQFRLSFVVVFLHHP